MTSAFGTSNSRIRVECFYARFLCFKVGKSQQIGKELAFAHCASLNVFKIHFTHANSIAWFILLKSKQLIDERFSPNWWSFKIFFLQMFVCSIPLVKLRNVQISLSKRFSKHLPSLFDFNSEQFCSFFSAMSFDQWTLN